MSQGCKFSLETHLLNEVLGGGGGKAELGGLGGGAGAESPLPGESILFLGGSCGGRPGVMEESLGGATGGS